MFQVKELVCDVTRVHLQPHLEVPTARYAEKELWLQILVCQTVHRAVQVGLLQFRVWLSVRHVRWEDSRLNLLQLLVTHVQLVPHNLCEVRPHV